MPASSWDWCAEPARRSGALSTAHGCARALVTLALWVVSIAVRVGIGVASRGATPLDTITFFLAITFAAQNLAVWMSMGGARAVASVGVR